MYSEHNTPSNSCADGSGTMPSCAPLAVPYVPFQQYAPKKYSQTDALKNGTLFPGLNLPFKAKVEGTDVAATALSELQALEFVLTELALYLDTHPDDQEAFALFQQYTALEEEARASYEQMYGPLTHMGAAKGDRYTWLEGTWPWHYEKGGAN